jgi:hypothetical protein
MFDTSSCTAAAAAGLLTVLRSPEHENGGQGAKTSSVESISRVPAALRDAGAEAATLEVQQHSLQRHAAATTQAGASSWAQQQEYHAWQRCVFASLSPFSPSFSLAFSCNVTSAPCSGFHASKTTSVPGRTLRHSCEKSKKEVLFLFFNSVPART